MAKKQGKPTTNQVNQNAPNPTGKGGFGDNPQNRSSGRWSKENSFSYWYNYFKSLTVKEFKEYEKTNPDDGRTVAESLAYHRVVNARKDLREFTEVADRSEGRPTFQEMQDEDGETYQLEPVQVMTIRNRKPSNTKQKPAGKKSGKKQGKPGGPKRDERGRFVKQSGS